MDGVGAHGIRNVRRENGRYLWTKVIDVLPLRASLKAEETVPGRLGKEQAGSRQHRALLPCSAKCRATSDADYLATNIAFDLRCHPT